MKIYFTVNEYNIVNSISIKPYDHWLSQEITEAEYEDIKSKFGRIRYINGSFEYAEDLVMRDLEIAGLQMEHMEIEAWFNQTDYYNNKIVTGEWSTDHPTWQQYLIDRRINAERLEYIRQTLGGYDNEIYS